MNTYEISAAIIGCASLASAVLLSLFPAYYQRMLNSLMPEQKPSWIYGIVVLVFLWASYLWFHFPSNLSVVNALICLVVSLAFIKMVLLLQRYMLFRQIVLSVVESDKIARIILAVCAAAVGFALLFLSFQA